MDSPLAVIAEGFRSFTIPRVVCLQFGLVPREIDIGLSAQNRGGVSQQGFDAVRDSKTTMGLSSSRRFKSHCFFCL